MEMQPRWMEASDENQIPFMLAAKQVFQGKPVPCPKCNEATLRYYFHIFDRQRGRGTIWAWCPNCFTQCHLPRVSPQNVFQVDPFDHLTLDQFAELELDPKEPLVNRLNRLWEEGRLV
ncbi:MAG: hypothetical protein HC877_20870 [Thioploca sp.]|nr:hypothetical protein [Thioploca sp.]